MAEENKYNIKIECGADFVLPFTWYDNNGNPMDLTGATVEAQLRETSSSPDAYDFICSHNGAGGRIVLNLPHEITSQISFSYGVYDVYVNFQAGGRKRPLYGDVAVQDHVTKPVDGTLILVLGFNTYEDFPAVGDTERLYLDYSNRQMYRWNGANYVSALANGINGISFKRHVNDFVDEYTITFDDGRTFDYQVISNGVTSVQKMGSSGTVAEGILDTYRMHFYNGTYFDYTVRNGKQGPPGDASLKLKRLAFEDVLDYESDLLINKPEPIGVTIERLRSLMPDLPYPIWLALYLADETLYLDSIGTYDSEDEAITLPTTAQGVTFEYIPDTESIKITVTGSYVFEDAPSDDNFYARRNGAWVTISSGGSLSQVSYDTINEALVFTEIDPD